MHAQPQPHLRLVALGGPVTAAIRAAAAAHAVAVDELRRALADRIEADLALLDALDGDPDLEPGGDAEPDHDAEPTAPEWSGHGVHYLAGGLSW